MRLDKPARLHGCLQFTTHLAALSFSCLSACLRTFLSRSIGEDNCAKQLVTNRASAFAGPRANIYVHGKISESVLGHGAQKHPPRDEQNQPLT